MTYTLFLVLIMIVAFLLILIIMVQNPKGGGLSSSFGGTGTQSLGGVQNTTNFLDKSTWTLSIVLLALILLSNFAAPITGKADTSSEIQNTIENREIQDIPAQQPATSTTLKDSAQ
ncbi:preprotein translocase subunit SecG [Lutibacter profundi]|uniref:Protein-export membrane protein SecG n=1 Tax=Lutibacter profundi TaxID=1622118 RepID=A0A0X8G831_9FLAO|nr:preprotein translocase subunit SecG [Lutibacter profundi]AMC11820.1 preprotein translocase subunit SecG [Lutibacter profundi]